MLERYKTIKEAGTNEIEIKGSRFIAHFQRVTDEEQALEFIQAIKKNIGRQRITALLFSLGKTTKCSVRWMTVSQVVPQAFQC